MSSLSLKAKIFATVAAVGSATAVAGLGTFGTFTDTTNASTPVDSGIVNLDLGATGAVTNRLDVAATDIVPGDTIQRAFDLNATGTTSPLGSVTLTSTAPTSSLLNTDATNGLQLKIESCLDTTTGVNAWVESAAAPYTYTCPATATRAAVVAERAVIGSGVSMPGLKSLSTAGASDNLVMTLRLPTSADNTFQNLASTIRFTFDATQRTATNK